MNIALKSLYLSVVMVLVVLLSNGGLHNLGQSLSGAVLASITTNDCSLGNGGVLLNLLGVLGSHFVVMFVMVVLMNFFGAFHGH
jgi:preprotein translocase subunit SecG